MVFSSVFSPIPALGDDRVKERKEKTPEPVNEAADLDAIVVVEDKIVAPTKEVDDTVYTGNEVTTKGMEIEGSKADTSVYNAVDALPGISVESADPYGLGAEQKNIRVRGVRGYLGSLSVEGVPNWGGNPMGPREYIYDTENLDGVAVYKGAVPADLGTGVGARGAALELRPRWPEEKLGGDVDISVGRCDFFRSYYRIDSGILPFTETRTSLSYSYANADKWKGPGTLGPRNNANFMLLQPAWGKDSVKLWFNFNDIEQDLYRSLSYSEVQDLNANYENEYRARLTGQRELDIDYYGNNRANLTNVDVLAVVPITLNNTYQLSFKPCVSTENSNILGGSPARGGIVSKRIRDFIRAGMIAEISALFLPGEIPLQTTLGYLFEGVDMKVNTQNYHPTTFAYQGWGNYSKSDQIGALHSPYLKLYA